ASCSAARSPKATADRSRSRTGRIAGAAAPSFGCLSEHRRALVEVGLRGIQLAQDELIAAPHLQLRPAAARDHPAALVADAPELAIVATRHGASLASSIDGSCGRFPIG